MAKVDVARKAARAYYGFSETPTQFPRGTDVEVYRKGEINVKESMFLSALASDVEFSPSPGATTWSGAFVRSLSSLILNSLK